MNKIRKYLDCLENLTFPPWYWGVAFFTIILLRNLLECFSSADHSAIEPLSFFLYLPLFYTSLFLSLGIVLYLLTKEDIKKIGRILVYGFTIILLPPILDLIVSGGKGYFMMYMVISSLEQWGRNFITFFGLPFVQEAGITVGIKIECIIAILASGIYVYAKRRSLVRALAGSILFYIILFLYSSAPFLKQLLNVNSPNIWYIYYILVVVQGLILLANSKNARASFKNIRPLRLLHWFFLVVAGIGLNIVIMETSISAFLFRGIVLLFSIAFVWMFSVGVNDIFDVDIDRISNPKRPIIMGMGQEVARTLNLLWLALALMGALLVEYQSFVFVLLFALVAWVYSVPPFRLKRIPILATFIIALASLFTFFASFSALNINATQPPGALTLNIDATKVPPRVIFLILTVITLSANFKDIKDIDGDRKAGVHTLMTIFGERKGKRIIGVLASISYLIAPLILGIFNLYLLIVCIFFSGINYHLFIRSKFKTSWFFTLYFLYVIIVWYGFKYPIVQAIL